MESNVSSTSTSRRNDKNKHVVLKLCLGLLLFLFFSFFFSVIIVQYYYYHDSPLIISYNNNNNNSNNNNDLLSLPALPFPNKAAPTKSGYIPITKTQTNSMFYAFYEAQFTKLPLPTTPIIVWLQGGPGCSSMYGNFLELGPWTLHDNLPQSPPLILRQNPGAWNRLFGVLFLDNPIGSGYSLAADRTLIPTDQPSVAAHLHAAISNFLDLHFFRSRPLFIAGESYAGKYIPAIGRHILEQNSAVEAEKIDLRGVAIGNGLVDALTQGKTQAAVAFYSGLVNERQRRVLEALQAKVAALVEGQRLQEASDARYAAVDALESMSGLATLFDYTKKRPYRIKTATEYLNQRSVKGGLRANERARFGGCSDAVHAALREDTMRSATSSVEFLLRSERVKVLLYQGLYDLWDGVVSTEAWVKTMSAWGGTDEFLRSERRVWRDESGDVAGYVQRFGNLSNVVVHGAGHLVPVDQPVNARVMIEDWILGRGMFHDEAV